MGVLTMAGGASGSTPVKDETPDYGSTGSEDQKKETGDEDHGGDEGEKDASEENDEKDPRPWEAENIEGYMKARCFIFVHHFAGKDDPLSAAVKEVAEQKKVWVKIYSVEKDNDSGDLLADQPYRDHLRWAETGQIDGYHSGFPCSTFSVLRFREAPGMPPPIRTKDEPYGRKENSRDQQRQCDEGTVMACRSIDIATLVAQRPARSKVLAVATLENPPPSNNQQHLSAWELPEMKKFVDVFNSNFKANFNTCRYEPELEVGKKHFKPQLFAGTLFGIENLSKTCTCGAINNHDPITGYEKSRASATYPRALCVEYAELLVNQFNLMGKAEFYALRMERLSKELAAKKAGLSTTPPRVKIEQTKRKALPMKMPEHEEPKDKKSKATEGTTASASSGAPQPKRAAGDEGGPEEWKGGEGKYDMLRKSKSKRSDPKYLEYYGGLRDPHAVVLQMANLQSVGLRVRAAFEALVRSKPGIIKAAETYGAKDCELEEKYIQEWRAQLRKILGARAPPAVRIKPKWAYTSPLQGEIIQAWCEKGNDPEKEVAKWILEGAPLGIEEKIKCCNVFPPADSDDELQELRSYDDAITQLSRGEITNYTSVTNNIDDAKIEIERYKKEGYLKEVTKTQVEEEFPHGTISRLGLIVKEKPEKERKEGSL